MNIKIKKHNQDGVVKLESFGRIKEIVINEDFLHPNKASIAVCFKGMNSSGILELSPEEVEFINKNVVPKLHLLKGAKVLKFAK